MDRFGVYVHIPFCKRKCKYCDFISFSCDEYKIEKYFNTLVKEIENKKVNIDKKVTTIYIGGGTPSLPNSKNIVLVLNAIKRKFTLDDDVEITIEINPGTITKEKLLDYKEAGINRISIGLQSTNDRILELIGRIHTYQDFLDTYNLAKEVGYTNINVDLMLGIPTQTEEDVIQSIKEVINLNPTHISLYSLILEDNTPLKEMIEKNELNLVKDEIERKMYWSSKKILEKNNYIQYEISNFSKKGFESKHNLDCWNQEEYIGYGLSAHSYINRKRFSNTENFEEYIKGDSTIQINETQTEEEQMKEYMMIGFRKIQGISISEFEKKFRINPLFYFRFEIDKLVKKELIEVDLNTIKLTSKGLDFANLVFEEFI